MASNGRGKQHVIPTEKKTTWFFKIILNPSLQAGQLKLSNRFTKKYGDNLPNPIFLKPRDDMQWKVYWTRRDDGGICLQKGWKEFATYYSLKHGHLLMFKYDETCNIKVLICDESALEIDYFGCIDYKDEIKDHSQDGQPHENLSTHSIGSVGQSSHLPENVQSKDIPQGPPSRKRFRRQSSGAVGQCSKLPKHVQIRKKTSKDPQPPKNLRTHTSEVAGQSSKLLNRVQARDDKSQSLQPSKKLRTLPNVVVGESSKLPQHAQENSEQSQENRGGASISNSETPSFTIVLKPSYVKGYSMILPSSFVNEHLKEKHGEDFLLRVLDGRVWSINYRFGRFCTGWKDFASANNLKVGDICLFEFTKSQMVFEVTIIQGGDEDFLEMIPALTCKIDVPVKAMQESTKFNSRNPFFKVIIKGNGKGDCRPRVPIAFKTKYFNDKYFVILQSGDISYRVHLIGKVPTKLSKGWFQFAKTRQLQVDDVCIFELIDKIDLVFNVHIFRGHSNIPLGV